MNTLHPRDEEENAYLKTLDYDAMTTIKPYIPPTPEEGEEEGLDQETAGVLFFCRNCQKIVQVEKKQTKKKMQFACKECGKKEIAFGTETSIQNYFHIGPDGEAKESF